MGGFVPFEPRQIGFGQGMGTVEKRNFTKLMKLPYTMYRRPHFLNITRVAYNIAMMESSAVFQSNGVLSCLFF
jgi:hypothetical protein